MVFANVLVATRRVVEIASTNAPMIPIEIIPSMRQMFKELLDNRLRVAKEAIDTAIKQPLDNINTSGLWKVASESIRQQPWHPQSFKASLKRDGEWMCVQVYRTALTDISTAMRQSTVIGLLVSCR